jgi:flagellar export protein FliJ
VKSKYTPLVKLKKKELDHSEQEVIKANLGLQNATGALEESYLLLSTLSLPVSGSVSELLQTQSMIQTQHEMIEQCTQALALAKAYQLQIQRQFKKAMIEYEKFNYLQAQELEAHKAKIKKEEAKMLDEIGVITYKSEPL